MLRNIFLIGLTLVLSAVITWIVTGKMDSTAIAVFSLFTFGLFYTFTLWLAFFDIGNAAALDRIVNSSGGGN
ncbi:MAG: hypothetical protein R2681_07890 [Pyrinomonadaceae bacterium]